MEYNKVEFIARNGHIIAINLGNHGFDHHQSNDLQRTYDDYDTV